MARPPAHRPCPRTRYRPTSRGEGALAAVTGRVKQTVLAGHRFGSHTATSPATGLDTTLRQPDGPSRGSSSTAAPSRRACSVASPIRSTSAYGSHSGRRVWHSMIPAHSRTQVQRQIAARAAADQLRPPLQQLRIKGARPHLVAGVKFQVYYPPRSCPHCVHSGAHASDDRGRPQDLSEDAVNAGRWLAGEDGLAG